MRTTITTSAMALAVTVALTGCAADGRGPDIAGLQAAHVDGLSSPKVERARAQFAQRQYGKAAKLFEAAVETDPNDAEAWLGLAASYDHIRRFDLADRAYEQVGELTGQTAPFLNNVGYSFFLRGDLDNARQMLMAAISAAPDDPHIRNNVALLNARLEELGRPAVQY